MRNLWIILLFNFIWSQAKVDVSVDRNRMYEGESITLTVSVENGESPEVNMSVITDFKISSGPSSSTNMQWINGKMSSTHSLSWTLVPKKKGKLRIPSLRVQIDDKSVRSKPINITVLDRKSTQTTLGDIQSAQQYYIEADVDNAEPYRGEQIVLTYTLYTKVNLSSFDIRELPRMTGFWSQDLYNPRNLQFREVTINKERWYAATVKEVALFPTKSGEITIDPATIVIGVKSGGKRRSFSFFDDPFFSRSKQVTLATNPVKIHVKSLPKTSGKTSAAVGQWKVSSKIDRISVKQDEAVTLTIIIQGTGNLKSVDIDDIYFPQGLETFEPEITITESPFRDKLGGKKTIEYVMIPRREGKINIPGVELTYFDLKNKKWKTSRSRTIQLSVTPNEKSIPTTIGLSKEEIALVGSDIRFTNLDDPQWQRRSTALISTRSIIFYSIAMILFLLPTTINLRKSHRDSTHEYRKAKSALRKALNALKQISGVEPEKMYTQIHQILNGFISDKLNQNVVRSGKEIIDICLDHSIDELQLEKLSTIIQNADAVRYAPVTPGDAENDLENFRNLLPKIDEQWK